jgi:hypothetical protein
VGAATGGTGGLLHGLWTGTEPDPVFVNFVDRCLCDGGYELISARFVLRDEYTNQPAAGAKRNSLFVTLGLSLIW